MDYSGERNFMGIITLSKEDVIALQARGLGDVHGFNGMVEDYYNEAIVECSVRTEYLGACGLSGEGVETADGEVEARISCVGCRNQSGVTVPRALANNIVGRIDSITKAKRNVDLADRRAECARARFMEA